MTNQQANNIFYFLGIMLMDNKIINTSPDYLEEKSLSFFGKLGKKEFVSDIKNIYQSQKISVTINGDFWYEYCKRWGVDQNNNKIMNIINFILNSNITNQKNVIHNYVKYIGEIDTITNSDLSCKIHPNIQTYIDKNIDFNSRYFKLLSLNKN